MDQIKIGKFIAECRKKQNLTQAQLAEKLNITDRAVSKWETGKSMPDSSIMLELCNILKVSANDLLCGEIVTTDNYNEKADKNILELIKQKEQADKRLLTFETISGVGVTAMFLILTLTASYIPMSDSLRILLISSAIVVLLIWCFYAIKIEQVAGYYECQKCGKRYIPSYKSVLLAPHMGRTRHMRCPGCGEKSWQKKVIGKNKD